MYNKIRIYLSTLILTGMALAACLHPPQIPTTPVQTQTMVVSQPAPVKLTIPVPSASPSNTVPPSVFKSKDPTTYVAATIDMPKLIDPALTYDAYGGQIIQNTYDTLIFYNREDPNSFVPMLATEVPSLQNGGISPDGRTYTFKIRSNVKFHDGTEMTPADVAYTFQRGILQGSSLSPQWLLVEPILGSGLADITDLITPSLASPDIKTLIDDPVDLAKVPADVLQATCNRVTDAIEADDAAGTVTFRLAQSWGPFLATLAGSWGSIQSRAWVASRGGWDGDCATWQKYYGKTADQLIQLGLGDSENGTGPYKLEYWTPGEEVVLLANHDYWIRKPLWDGGPSGAPRLKKIIIKFVDDFSTRFAMLEAGDADDISLYGEVKWPQMDTLVGVECQESAENCQEVDSHKPLKLIMGLQSTSRIDMFFTFDINAQGNLFIGSGQLDGNGIPSNFFSDPRVRKGMAFCFNYDSYLNDALLGAGLRSVDVMLPGMIGYDETTPFYTYDPSKCRDLLQQSQWRKNSDGSWVPDPDGDVSLWDVGFRFTAPFNKGLPVTQIAAQILQTELAAINNKFQIDVTGQAWPDYIDNMQNHNAPVYFSGWLEDIHDPHNWVVPYTTGSHGYMQKLPSDIKRQFADMINRAVIEPDPARRAEIYKEFNQLYYDTASSIPLFVSTAQRYQQRWVQGWYHNPIYPGRYFYTLWKE
jgi:peptide/nickel transport system substrate-binding protein